MFLGPPNTGLRNKSYSEAYNRILSQHRRSPMTSASSVIILVAPDVDALCASKMLADLLKQDDILHRIIPVSGIAELERWRDDLASYKELHTLILLNMGAILDLPSDEWFGGFNTELTVHIIDSNRPQNLSTLFGSGDHKTDSRIILWDDGGASEMEELQKAWESVLYEPEPSDDDSDSDDDTDLHLFPNDGGTNDGESSLEEADLGEGTSSGKKRSSSGTDERRSKRSRREQLEQRRVAREARAHARERRIRSERLINKHYTSGTWYGQSVAGTLYTLAVILNRVDNEMLWLAIVGLTFQFITSRISRDTYNQYQRLFDDEVVRLNPVQSKRSSGAAPFDFEGISSTIELRFTLLRHWSPYDAMIHSSYVANKLSTWKERGRRKLVGLFAKMGYSIPDAQQSYHRIPNKIKEELNERLDQIAPEYGLIELTYPSFVRYYGYQRQPTGAADTVEALSALLDVGGRVKIFVEEMGARNGGEWFSGGKLWEVGGNWREEDAEDPTRDPTTEGEETRKRTEWWIRNFWSAYDALTNPNLTYEAMFLSMSIHRAIIREGCSIIEKQQVKTMNRHRVVILTQGPDLELLAQPGTLSRLALWLVDTHRDRIQGTQIRGRKKKVLPFVIACLDEKAGNFLVVGVTAALDYGDVRKNPFGLAFLEAKERCNARARHGSFDTSVLEINKDDLNIFLQALCND